ncbi:MAG: helix-hairpin-helix domain-containing protein [Bacilli bacterium]|nr:helix-hairpin-helix domain-containing protein [Bacilli bacterium]
MNLFKRWITEILLVIIIVLLLGLYCWEGYKYYVQKDNEEDIVQSPIENFEEVVTEPDIVLKKYVDVKGAVVNPGVYEISNETIINDVISMAGGFKSTAYTNNINLSMKIKDETVIYVYTKYEYSLLNKKEENKTEIVECNCEKIDISSCINNGSSVIENGESKENEDIKEDIVTSNENELININTATLENLMTLNGIGEAKATSIINYRNENGNFTSIEDIKLVSGISDNLYEKIKNYITV